MRRAALAFFAFLALAAAPAHAAAPGKPISSDPFGPNVAGQHQTQVEPDSFSFGNTVVTAFQVGRYVNGGAAAIGWATSLDGGNTWRSGILPSLTPFTTPVGPYGRVSDPAVAYDRVHGVWLISILALVDSAGAVGASAIVTARSTDGLSWSAPVTTAPNIGSFIHDKNWIVCDNGASSPFAGRCYTAWTDVPTDGSIAISTSLDGGASWGVAVYAPGDAPKGNGAIPVVLPSGTLVIPYSGFAGTMHALNSPNGGATLGGAVGVAFLPAGRPTAMRAPPLPSAEVDGAGQIWLAWHSCVLNEGCSRPLADAPNDIMLSSSTDGTTWTQAVRVATGTGIADRFLPGLGADPAASGRLGIAYHVMEPYPCSEAVCRLRVQYVYSADGGRRWSSPVELTPQPMSISWISATSQGRMTGDYISTSFVTGGIAVPVFSAAQPPDGNVFHQSIHAATIGPLAPGAQLAVRGFGARRQAGGTVRATLLVRGSLTGAQLTCAARAGGKALRLVSRRLERDKAECTWRLPAGKRRLVAGSVTVRVPAATLARAFRLP